MKEKVDLIIAQTVNNVRAELDLAEKMISERDFREIFIECFTEALEEAEDDLMQLILWQQLLLKFHPDNSHDLELKDYLIEEQLTKILQEVLISLNGNDLYLMSSFPEKDLISYKDSYILVNERLRYIRYSGEYESKDVTITDIPKFLTNISTIKSINENDKLHLTSAQVKKFITLNGGHTPDEKIVRWQKFLECPEKWFWRFNDSIIKNIEEEGVTVRQRKSRRTLEKQPVASRFYSMISGLNNYFQPVGFLFKGIFYFVFISFKIAITLLYLLNGVSNKILSFPKRFINFLISIVTNDEFSRQVDVYKKSVREKKESELTEKFNAFVKAGGEASVFPSLEELNIDDIIINDQVDKEIELNSFFYLKFILFGFYSSLVKNISHENLIDRVLFVISWPFRFIAGFMLLILVIPIELIKQVFEVIPLLVLAVDIVTNAALLFLLNLPRYIFFEIPHALINWVQMPGDVNTKEDNLDNPSLISTTPQPEKVKDFYSSPTPKLCEEQKNNERINETISADSFSLKST